MPVTHAELWKLLQDSRLIPATRMAEVEAVFTEVPRSPGTLDVRSMTAWLIRERVLTRYQADQLLRGRGGPFFYGDYRVIDRIREGRLRGLFRAVHEPTQFEVLLRFAPPRVAQDPRLWTHVRQHQRGHTRLNHPHLQRVYSLEDMGGHRFLVLEDLAGDALAESLEPGSALRPADACSVVHMTALGLAALHEQRHAYGDVRPANLWLDPAGHLKLLRDFVQPPVIPDFTRADLSESAAQQVDYLAPELAHLGTRINPATDIYALGCTFFELLSGEPPFAGTSLNETLERHAHEPVVSLEPFGVPSELVDVLARMLAKNPLERIASAREVAERMVPHLDPPVVSVPVPAAAPDNGLAFEAALGRTGWAPPAPPPIITNLPSPPRANPVPMESPVSEPPCAPAERVLPRGAESTLEPPFAFSTTHEPGSTARRTRRRKRSPRTRALTLGSLALVIAVLAIAYYLRVPAPLWQLVLGLSPDAITTPPHSTDAVPTDPMPVRHNDASDAAPQWTGLYQPIPDDGQSLWMPPTNGQPIQVTGIPPGAQMLMFVRARDVVRTAAGQRLLRSLGEEMAAFRQQWEATAGFSWEHVERITICWSGNAQSLSDPTYIVQLHEPPSREQIIAAWGQTEVEGTGDTALYRASTRWFRILPGVEDGQFVMGPEAAVREVPGLPSERPVLRRELAQLLAASDDQSLATVLVVPSFLHDALAQDAWGPLHRALPATDWLLGDAFAACQVSLCIGATGYLELRGCGRTGADSLQLAEALRQRMRELPTRIEQHFQDVYPDTYWRPIALRMPEMIRFLTDYTRVGIEDDQAIVNSVLPPQALHSLLFASQMLILADSADKTPTATTASTAPTASPSVTQTMTELLSTKMSFRFAAQSLEFAIRDLAESVRENHPQLPFPFDIQILGSDLQLQGITRNQQIGEFEAVDKPLAEILTTLVMRANPVTTVTTASDPNQKLVWIQGLDPADANRPILLITTRDAAQRRNDTLPGAFQPK